MKQNHMLKALSKTLTLTRPVSSTRSLCSSSSSSSSTTPFAIKNVTKSNFDAALHELRGHVREADFVAIDLEMTGVTSAPWRESFEFDRFDVRYLKVKDSAEKFAVVQFGVCPFKWDPLHQSFIAHPHNFYIFPRQEIPGDSRCYEFLCQTTSIDFLARYQFDFNMCIREGVSYLSRSQEEEALRRLNSTCKDELPDSVCALREASDMQLVRMADILFAERMRNKIAEWRDGLLRDTHIRSEFQHSSKDSNQKLHTTFFKMRPAVILEGFSSHQLSLIKMVAKKHFNDLEYIRVPAETSGSQHLIVFTDSLNDRELLLKEVKECLREEAEMKIKAATGFRQVIDLLSSEQKLIVGHNCFLDIAHVYNKFIGPLPLTAEEYAHSVRKYFPYIIDTKVLLNASNIFQHMVKKSSTSLSKAFSLLCPQIASGAKGSSLTDKLCVKVEVQVDDKRSLNWNSGAKHEAGYDAFMTGCVFAQASSHLGVDFKLHEHTAELANNEKLQKYINQLYLSWINGDIIDLKTGKCSAEISSSNNLKGRYPKILFSNIILVWGLPPRLKANEMRECLSKVFGPTSVTSVYHLDETAVFIQFSKEELVHDFLELKETLERSNGPISVLHPLSKILEGGRTSAANYDAYREICSSPISKVFFADQAEAVGIEQKNKNFEQSDVEMQGDESFDKGHEMNSFSDYRDQSRRHKESTSFDDPPYNRVSTSDRLVDSMYPAEAQVSK